MMRMLENQVTKTTTTTKNITAHSIASIMLFYTQYIGKAEREENEMFFVLGK
jgi:hypothetical protein